MSNINRFKKQRGFSILEVLFSMVVLSIALLATARMHALVTQDGGFSKVRAVAVNLAQEKLDDLRSFTLIADSVPATTPDECAAPVFCFTEIASSDTSNLNVGGGREQADGTLEIKSGSVTIHNTAYDRTWMVTNYYRCGTAAPSTTNCASPNTKAYPDFKVVVITVAWTDEQNNPRSVVMRATIHASGLTGEANSLAAPYGGGGPKVSYRPIGVPDAVPVPINVGGTKQKESSKPLPDVSTSGESKLVSFDVVTYDTNQSLGDGTYLTLQREEFSTVNCVCKYASGTSSQYTASRYVWNGTSLEPKIGGKTAKPTATAHTSGSNADPDQPAECTKCCAEHHDTSATSYAKYDPDRAVGDYYSSGNASGDHKHYWWTTVGTPSAGLTAVAGNANDIYLEACRFARVNGELYLWQDWRLVDLTVFDYGYLQISANLSAYQTYLINKMKYKVRTDGSISGTHTDPSKPTGRDSTVAQGASKRLLSRAVYLDRIYQANSPSTLDSTYYSAIDAKITANTDWLLHVPFYEINLTLLDDWSSSNSSNVSVTMQKVGNIVDPDFYYNSYSRGSVTGNIAGSSATITARALASTSGLVSGVYSETGTNCPATAANCISYGIDTQDNTTVLTDSITVTVGSAAACTPTQYIISGSINLATGNVTSNPIGIGNANAYSFASVTGLTCSGSTTQCGVTTDLGVNVSGGAALYNCAVTSGWSGNLQPQRSDYTFDAEPGNSASQPFITFGAVSSGQSNKNFQVCKGTACANP